ncbi:MAG TPA: Holliday junction branch migration DNA helicase RuvB [Patescibacteria group bacterium]|nr:Holliday junction branch migration DNA helicase RuvB [Patescibacteria group bacterium]
MKSENVSLESQLRPKSLREYIGQKKIIQSLQLFVDAVLKRGSVAEHILLYGPPGIGKTTLAYILANELKGELKITSGPALEKSGDLAAILTNLKDNDVLFVDEIHRMPKAVEETLYPVMEEYFLDIVIGKGPAARTVRLPIPRITIIGATTRVALLSAPLRDRFGMILRLDFYSDEEMLDIVLRSAEILKIPTDKKSAQMIADRSRKTPRLANRILKRARDLYEVGKHKKVDEKVIRQLFSILEIDTIGLTFMDKEYLRAIADKFGGGPVGVSTLSASLSEDRQTIEDFIEPYLIQIGFIKKTTQGRVLTEAAYQHLGYVLQKIV